MPGKAVYFSRTLLTLYFIGLCLCCFTNFSSGIDFGGDWFGIPKDKAAHFLMFFPFPFFVHFAFPNMRDTPLKAVRFVLMTVVAGALTGGAIELLQGMTDFRSCELKDFIADCSGLTLSSFLILGYESFIRKWSTK